MGRRGVQWDKEGDAPPTSKLRLVADSPSSCPQHALRVVGAPIARRPKALYRYFMYKKHKKYVPQLVLSLPYST